MNCTLAALHDFIGNFALGKLLCILACCLGAESPFAEFMIALYCASGLCATRLTARAIACLTRHFPGTFGFQTETRAGFHLAALIAFAGLNFFTCLLFAVPTEVGVWYALRSGLNHTYMSSNSLSM